ncbi:hypothetical protein [Symbioplanes lichenis]|nr:hypothetical protein [Actinoplanes lichenis]
MDLDTPRKQRHTAKRIIDRLIAEQVMANGSTVIGPGSGPRAGCPRAR